MAFILDQKNKNISAYQKSIKDKKESIVRYYDEIGRLYYSFYKDLNSSNTKDINTRCEAITRLTSEIDQLNHKILFEKGLKLCQSCKTENNLEYTFCYKCGTKFTEKTNDDADDDVVDDADVDSDADDATDDADDNA